MSNVNVIIPFKSNLIYLFQALNSVFDQSYKHFKIILIYDDTDRNDLVKIKEFVKEKKFQKKVKIIVNKKNMGAGISRNIGIKHSNYKYIAFLDSDDRWLKNKLKIQIKQMSIKNLKFSHTSYFITDTKGQVKSKRKAKKILKYKNLVRSCDIGLSTVMVENKFLKRNNLFFPNISTKEDYILWLGIIKNIKTLAGLNQYLTFYRNTPGSLSSNILRNIKNGYLVYYKYMKFSFFKSIFCLLNLSFNFLKKKLYENFNSYK